MKYKKIFAILLCLIFLSGCNSSKAGIKDQPGEPKILPPDFSTEEGISYYLTGEWFHSGEYREGMSVSFIIDEGSNIELSFFNEEKDESPEYFSGVLKLDRLLAGPNEAPDIIVIELKDTDHPGGEFFFKHRTNYEGKRILSLFFAANGNSIFDSLYVEEYPHAPSEIIFEKRTDEDLKVEIRKNDKFHGVFWGVGGAKGQGLWIDDVIWKPSDEKDHTAVYPGAMTKYENDVKVSALYNIAPDMIDKIFEGLAQGEVYYIETDEKGNIKTFENVEQKKHLEEEYFDQETEELIFEILLNDTRDTKKYLDMGMDLFLEKETISLFGADCYSVALGTSSQEQFVREIHYGVNTLTRTVYKYDVINDKWNMVK